jgi:hypothetical protein
VLLVKQQFLHLQAGRQARTLLFDCLHHSLHDYLASRTAAAADGLQVDNMMVFMLL